MLKKERTDYDVKSEIDAYKKEIDTYAEVDVFVEKLKEINGKIWDLESEGGREDTLEPSDDVLIKIGKIAIAVRHWNRVRNGVKEDIIEKFSEGFKEIKINYTKTDYGWNSYEG